MASNILLYKQQHYIKLILITAWYIWRNYKIQALSYLGKRGKYEGKIEKLHSQGLILIFFRICTNPQMQMGYLAMENSDKNPQIHKWLKISLKISWQTGDPFSIGLLAPYLISTVMPSLANQTCLAHLFSQASAERHLCCGRTTDIN